ncbi:kinesin-like protein kif23 [Moniliophthora roreri]|nr:kinesin-like protein kif23 [Moniliophthora roreri]
MISEEPAKVRSFERIRNLNRSAGVLGMQKHVFPSSLHRIFFSLQQEGKVEEPRKTAIIVNRFQRQCPPHTHSLQVIRSLQGFRQPIPVAILPGCNPMVLLAIGKLTPPDYSNVRDQSGTLKDVWALKITIKQDEQRFCKEPS